MSVISGIGVAVFAVGIYLIIDALILIRSCTEKTTGVLVVMKASQDYDFRMANKIVYSPVYSYEVEGVEYQSVAKAYTNNPADYEMGSTAVVKYNPYNPEICIIGNRNGKTGMGLILVTIGILLFFIGM